MGLECMECNLFISAFCKFNCCNSTKFSDLTQHEFETTLLGSKSGKSKSFPGIESEVVSHIPAVAATTSVDWSGIYTTPVKDQGYCGSCWYLLLMRCCNSY